MDDLEKRIRQRAFRIWVEEGYPAGKHREHWVRAKAEVLASEPRFNEEGSITNPGPELPTKPSHPAVPRRQASY